MAQGALDAATSYAKQRKQFGKAISEFQAIQFKLADMATEVEAARLLVYQAAWHADQKSSRFTRESSMAKLFASEVAVRVANECVQITAATVSSRTIPPKSFTATSNSARSAKAPAKFKNWSSPASFLAKGSVDTLV